MDNLNLRVLTMQELLSHAYVKQAKTPLETELLRRLELLYERLVKIRNRAIEDLEE